MKRADLENLKAEMSTRYAEQLEREQTHLTIDQRAHMCIGFEHGMGWLWKILESAGMNVEEDEPPRDVCMACRNVPPAAYFVRVRTRDGVPQWQCPNCRNWQART